MLLSAIPRPSPCPCAGPSPCPCAGCSGASPCPGDDEKESKAVVSSYGDEEGEEGEEE